MAHGIRAGILLTSPNIWGKELENEGAAWMEQKCILPMLSLAKRSGLVSLYGAGDPNSRVVEAECGLCLVIGNLAGNLDYVVVENTSDKLEVTEDERFLGVEADGDNVFCIASRELLYILYLELVLEQELFVVYPRGE